MTSAIPHQQLVEFAEAFELYDVDGEGSIPVTKLDLVVKTLGIAIPEAALLAMKQRKVDEGELNVDFTEFLHLVTLNQTVSEHTDGSAEQRAHSLRGALGMFDPQGTGFITVVDFRKAMRDSLKDAEIDTLVRKADPSGSGKIAYNELVCEMTGF